MNAHASPGRAASRTLILAGVLSVPVGLFTYAYPPAVAPDVWGYPYGSTAIVPVSAVLMVAHLLKAHGFVGLSRLGQGSTVLRWSMLAASLGFVIVAVCEAISASIAGVAIDSPEAVALDNGYGAGSMILAVASIVGGTVIVRRRLLQGFGRWSVLLSGAFMIFVVTPALLMGRGPAAYLTLTGWSLFYIWIGRTLRRPLDSTPAASVPTKKILRVALGFVALLGLCIGSFVATKVASWQPSFSETKKPRLETTDDPDVIKRGEYIVNALAHCGACHVSLDEYLALEPGESPSFKGGHEWDMGPLGTLRSTNITPDETTGIGSYSDAELARAIRHGVGKDDKGLLFMMAIGPMSDEDLIAVMSYIRTVPSVSNQVAEHEIGVLGKVLFQGPLEFFHHPHTYPQPPYVKESHTPSAERGRYLAEGPAGCIGCHSAYTPQGGQVEFIAPMMTGAQEPQPDETDPNFEFAGPNLTMDPETGHLTQWTKERFVKRLRNGRVYDGSPMPWESYRNMTDSDLESLWLYLKALPPIKNDVGPPRRKAGWNG